MMSQNSLSNSGVSPTIIEEFNSSLSSVRSLSEILRDYPGIDTANRDRFIALILDQTKRLIDLVNRLAETGIMPKPPPDP